MNFTPATWEISPNLTAYETALERMKARVNAIRDENAPDLVWLLEHPPLYTEGTSAKAEDLQDPTRFPTHKAGRGGQWTYHGPGQRVVYTMLDLTNPHGTIPAREIRCFVQGLERWMIGTLAEFGVKGEIREGRVGVWVETPSGEKKIGAIGVRVSRWVTWHGLSLNVNPELEHFSGIVPCGINEYGVTSLADLGVGASMQDVDAALRRNWAGIFE